MINELAKHLGVCLEDAKQAAEIAECAGYKPEDFEVTCSSSMVTKPGGFGHWYRQAAVIRIKPTAFNRSRK